MDALSSLTAAWNAKIPVKLVLSPSDITSPTAVKPVYFLAPRQGYLPVLAHQALQHFQHVLPNLPGGRSALKPWFEYQGLPLRWHLPAGVLHDLLAGEGELPWILQIHYTNFPAALQGSWENDVSLQQHYFNSLKEACYICCGNKGSERVMALVGRTQDDMWRSIERSDLASFKQSFDSIRVVPSQHKSGQGASIPVRIFIRQPSSEGLLALWEHTSSTSRPWPAQQQDGSATTLQQLLQGLAPALFPGPAAAGAEGQQGAAAAGGGGGDASGQQVTAVAGVESHPLEAAHDAPAGEAVAGGGTSGGSSSTGESGLQQQVQQQRQRQRLKVLVGGICPPLEAPVAWLHAHLHAPDYFLYVVVRADLAR